MSDPLIIEVYAEGPDGEESGLSTIPAPADVWADDALDYITDRLAVEQNLPRPLATLLANGILIELRRIDIEGVTPTTKEN